MKCKIENHKVPRAIFLLVVSLRLNDELRIQEHFWQFYLALFWVLFSKVLYEIDWHSTFTNMEPGHKSYIKIMCATSDRARSATHITISGSKQETWATILNLHLIWGVGRINCSNRWRSLVSCLCDKVDNKLYRFGIHLLLIPKTSKVTIWDEQVFISLGDLAPFTSLCYGRGNFSCSSRLGQSEGTLNVMNSFYSLKESNK